MTEMASTATRKDHDHSLSPGNFYHPNQLPCPYQQRLAILLSPATDTSHSSIPGTWVDSNLHYCYCQTAAAAAAAHHQEDMNHLRQTIASLRDQAKQLEVTDLMVKKSIQVVAKKRRLAQHSSQWDWCDPLDDDDDEDDGEYYDSDDDQGMESFHSASKGDVGDASIPVLDDDSSEMDHNSDWEWVDWI